MSISQFKIVVQWLQKVAKGTYLSICLICFFNLIGVLFSLLFIFSTKEIIDVASKQVDGNILHLGLLTSVFLLAQIGATLIAYWLSTKKSAEQTNILKRNLFLNVVQGRWLDVQKVHTGDIINRIEKDASTVVTLLYSTIPAILTTSIQLIASFVIFCTMDSTLPLLLVVIIPLLLLGGKFYLTKMGVYNHKIRHHESQVQSYIQERLQHSIILKIFASKETLVGKLNIEQEQLKDNILEKTKFSIFSRGLITLGFTGGYLLTFMWGAVRLSHGTISFGMMTAFLQLVGKIQRPIYDLSNVFPSLVASITAIERLNELTNIGCEAATNELIEKYDSIVFRNVDFSYPESNINVFSNFNLEMKTGSHWSIFGETGRGKTTFIRLLLGLIEPSAGSVVLKTANDEVPLSKSTRSLISYVPQGNMLFSGTIYDNLLLAKPNATPTELDLVLKIAEAKFVFDLPEGIHTRLTENGGGLSEGQAQRISIARALLKDASIVLLDEATSALDVVTEQNILSNIKTHCQDKLVVYITHHPQIADFCDYQLHL